MANGMESDGNHSSMAIRARIPRVSVADGVDSLDDQDNEVARIREEEEMHEAIIASLLEYTGTQNKKADLQVNEADKDEATMIKEVMQISKLEEEKKKGNINLDFLKRKNKQDKRQKENVSSIIPEPTQISNQNALTLTTKLQ